MGKQPPPPKVVDYMASMMIGFCRGPVDAVSGIQLTEKYIYPVVENVDSVPATQVTLPDGEIIWVAQDWRDMPTITANTELNVNYFDLFGGDEHEGGIAGRIGIMLGGVTQVMSDFFAGRWGQTSSTSPAYRNMLTLFFTHSWSPNAGFKWTTSSPILREVAVTVQRAPVAIELNPAERRIPAIPVQRERQVDVSDGLGEGGTLTRTVYDMFVAGPDANPAHIIYECLVDDDFGLGVSVSDIDISSFAAASTILFDEGLGISLVWSTQSTIHEFINEVEAHADGKLFVNPMTGKLTFRLVRQVTDLTGLFNVNETNAQMTSFQRKGWGDTINEVVVSWTNPYTVQAETSSVQNIANLAIQGRLVSDSKQYPGVRNAQTATMLAMRDMRTVAEPLSSCEILVNRSGWSAVPTDVVTVTWAEYGIAGVLFRVTKVDYGKPTDSVIKVSLVEDVFSNDIGGFVASPTSKGVFGAKPPTAIRFKRGFNLPAFLISTVTDLTKLDSSTSYIGVLSSQPSFANAASGFYQETVATNGDVSWNSVGTIEVLNLTYIPALAVEGTSVLTSVGTVAGGPPPSPTSTSPPPYVNWYGYIGNVADEMCEIVMVQSITYDVSGNPVAYYLVRGCFDTVPRAWPALTPCYWTQGHEAIVDTTAQTIGTTVDMKLTSRNPFGVEPLSDAAMFSLVVSERPHLPNRPGNITLNGKGLVESWTLVSDGHGGLTPSGTFTHGPELPYEGGTGLPIIHLNIGDDLLVAWGSRNRLLENSRVVMWNDGSVAPEAAQTARVIVRGDDAAVVFDHAGITAASFTLAAADWQARANLHPLERYTMTVVAERDGLASLQAETFVVIGPPPIAGYGQSYGHSYGAV